MKIYRIYFFGTITVNTLLTLSAEDSHHIITVLRLQKHNLVSIFNETGEWLSEIIEPHKTKTKVLPIKQTKPKEIIHEWIHLLYAPLKKMANSFLITKATELGINEITQVITEHTVNNPLEVNKIISKSKEAAQQCGRLSLPKVNTTISFNNFIQTINYNVLWLNEKQIGIDYVETLNQKKYKEKFNILIGPEAGFSNKEYTLLQQNQYISAVYLKGNILKAETAGIIAIGSIKYLK